MKERFRNQLDKYLPSPSIPIVYRWLSFYKVKLRISKPRTSKLGDFRINSSNKQYAISVNGNLNPYAFLITLTHEVAHMMDYDQRKTLKNAHGDSWKNQYTQLLSELFHAQVFPNELEPALRQHINRPKAASCSDPTLTEALRQYDETVSLLLREIPNDSKFRLHNGKVFRKGELKRTRFKCEEVSSGRWYMVHGDAPVHLIE